MYFGHNKNDGRDNREEKWNKEMKERGFDETELWSLGDTIVEYSLWIFSENKFESKIVNGLKIFVRDSGIRNFSEDDKKIVDNSLKLFIKEISKNEIIYKKILEFILPRLIELKRIETNSLKKNEEKNIKFIEDYYTRTICLIERTLENEEFSDKEIKEIESMGEKFPWWWW